MQDCRLAGDQRFPPQSKPDKEPAGLSCGKIWVKPLEIHFDEISIQAVLRFKVLNYGATTELKFPSGKLKT